MEQYASTRIDWWPALPWDIIALMSLAYMAGWLIQDTLYKQSWIYYWWDKVTKIADLQKPYTDWQPGADGFTSAVIVLRYVRDWKDVRIDLYATPENGVPQHAGRRDLAFAAKHALFTTAFARVHMPAPGEVFMPGLIGFDVLEPDATGVSALPGGRYQMEIVIKSGWRTQRCRFLMVLAGNLPHQSGRIVIVQGDA